MDILFVTATLPYPQTDGAKIRIFSFIKSLAARHKISVVSFATPADHTGAIEHLRTYCKDVLVVPRNPCYPVSKIIWGLVSSVPFPILNYWDPVMAALVKRVVESTTFDIVQAENLPMVQYCLGLPHRTILDLHNIDSLVMKRYAQQERHPFKRTYAEITWRKLAAYEREVCRQFTHCLTCSNEEQQLLRASTGVEWVSVVPNGVDVTANVPDETCERNAGTSPSARVVFVGRMDYHANMNGVEWFCREVLPLVRAQRPDTVFQIVGKNPTKEVKRLASPGQVEVVGFVEDVRPHVRAATVCVIPLRVGGGTRLKVLEALAMGKTVVSTSVGAEGIAAVPERDILIADDTHGFAKQIVRALEDAQLRKSLGRAGREVVESHYGWNRIGQRLEEVYERVSREPRTSSRHL